MDKTEKDRDRERQRKMEEDGETRERRRKAEKMETARLTHCVVYYSCATTPCWVQATGLSTSMSPPYAVDPGIPSTPIPYLVQVKVWWWWWWW